MKRGEFDNFKGDNRTVPVTPIKLSQTGVTRGASYADMPAGGSYSKHLKPRRRHKRRQPNNQGVRTMIRRIEIDADVIHTRSGGGSDHVNVVSVTAHGEATTDEPGAIGFTYTAQLTAHEWGELKPVLDRIDARMRQALGLNVVESMTRRELGGTDYQPKVDR